MLKSLYFDLKMTCNRIPVYFVLKHALAKRSQDVFGVLYLPLSTVKAVTVLREQLTADAETKGSVGETFKHCPLSHNLLMTF